MKPTIEYLPDQPGDMKRTLADVTLAARALGYAPKVSMEDGHPPLRRLVAHAGRHLVSRCGARRSQGEIRASPAARAPCDELPNTVASRPVSPGSDRRSRR